MIVVITHPERLPDESRIITSLFESGLEILHLRKKNYPQNELVGFIHSIPSIYYPRIVIHSHYHLANEFGFKGIHVPATSFKPDYQPVSVAFHSLQEIEEFKKTYQYGLLSPVFDSISKKGYQSNFCHSELSGFLKSKQHNILALGGVDINHIKTIKKLGFKGFALLGAIWQNPDPMNHFLKIKEEWNLSEITY